MAVESEPPVDSVEVVEIAEDTVDCRAESMVEERVVPTRASSVPPGIMRLKSRTTAEELAKEAEGEGEKRVVSGEREELLHWERLEYLGVSGTVTCSSCCEDTVPQEEGDTVVVEVEEVEGVGGTREIEL